MELTIRPATTEDGPFLYRLRSDPETSTQSFGPPPPDLGAHLNWLERTLRDTYTRALFVADEAGVSVATARLDYAGMKAELSYTVAPEARRRGVATEVIRMMVLMAHSLGVEWLTAQVKEGNLGSKRALAANGFAVEHISDDVVHYVRRLP